MQARGRLMFLLPFLLLLVILVIFAGGLQQTTKSPSPPKANFALEKDVDPLHQEEACAQTIEDFVRTAREDLKSGKKAIRIYTAIPHEGLLSVEIYFRPWPEVEKSQLPPNKTWWGYEVFRSENRIKPPTPTSSPFINHRERRLDETAIWCHVVYADGHVGSRTAEGLRKAGITAEPVVWDDHLGWKKLPRK